MKALAPLLVVVVLLVVFTAIAARNRRRALDREFQRAQSIKAGTEVMTTSGLYGRVTRTNDDEETVQLEIAPGLEVRWALAALRDVRKPD